MASSRLRRSTRAPRSRRGPRRGARRAGAALFGAALALAALLLVARPTPLGAWGEHGHRLAGAAAVEALPSGMPAFFRAAGRQLAYLNPEPDRWRNRTERELDPALDGATAPDHYVDLELIPAARRAAVLGARTRFDYADSLRAAGASAATVGLLPFRIVELTQRLRAGFRLWRAAPDAETRGWIEQRIVNDAGVLGHYVADGANPAHTTVHHNGWVGANPRGFATDTRFHSRFESAFVQARVSEQDLRAAMRGAPPARRLPDVRAAVLDYVRASHARVVRLYELDKRAPFGAENDRPEHEAFAVERLAAGTAMLRDLWWTAWVASADTTGAPSR
ncbi:MAG: hypothetical protein AVDCRST_MAG11-2792 [uncultured Gemmatimonadaceae bacterium]|uniref:Nuclease n=1 Tax=uncultured Gemmatimonadaceae bacterium TaxID=246130 RepID=A0A6J4LNZ3_9BACT|nr:MAG: hypothetical protein AVDCRST_MAG11-2792 [uncultured Gemmatimonadaceae bacterium]